MVGSSSIVDKEITDKKGLTLTPPSSTYYRSPPSLCTRNLPPPFLPFFIEFFRAVVKIYPPAGSLEPVLPAGGRRGGDSRGTTFSLTVTHTGFSSEHEPLHTLANPPTHLSHTARFYHILAIAHYTHLPLQMALLLAH